MQFWRIYNLIIKKVVKYVGTLMEEREHQNSEINKQLEAIRSQLLYAQQEKTLKEKLVNEEKKRNAEINQQLETIRSQLSVSQREKLRQDNLINERDTQIARIQQQLAESRNQILEVQQQKIVQENVVQQQNIEITELQKQLASVQNQLSDVQQQKTVQENVASHVSLLHPRIQIAYQLDPGHATTDVSNHLPALTKDNKKFQKHSKFCKVNNAILTGLRLDVQPPVLLENNQQNVVARSVKFSTLLKDIKSSIYQSIRLAKLDYLIGQPIFSKCDALVSPIATFGGLTVYRRTRSKVLGGNSFSHTPRSALESIEFICAFCNECISLAKVINCLSQSGSPKCTIEFLAKLSMEHRAECKALKGADRLMDEDVHYGISEGSSDIKANIKMPGSTQ